MKKSEVTRHKILLKGMEMASTTGLLSLSIGDMAKATGMSRTGVISHFENKEDMQIAILKFSEDEFVTNVLKKSYVKNNPLENLTNLITNWLNWISNLNFKQRASCPFIKASIEYKNQQDCLVKSYMQDQQQRLLAYLEDLAKRCVSSGQFREDVDTKQFAYEFDSFYIGHTIQKNLFDNDQLDKNFMIGIEGLVSRYLK